MSVHSNRYLLRKREGYIEDVEEWYNPNNHIIIVEHENGYETINLSPEDTAKQYMDIVKFQSSWCKYDR